MPLALKGKTLSVQVMIKTKELCYAPLVMQQLTKVKTNLKKNQGNYLTKKSDLLVKLLSPTGQSVLPYPQQVYTPTLMLSAYNIINKAIIPGCERVTGAYSVRKGRGGFLYA